MAKAEQKLPLGIIPRPPGPPIGAALPLWRFRLTSLFESRAIWFLSLQDRYQISLFLRELQQRLEPSELVILDANLWFDGGRSVASRVHTEIWWSAPLKNRIVQVWIPIMSWGSPEQISRSMLRVLPEPLADDWACAPGDDCYTHLYTGETRTIPYPSQHGIFSCDVPNAFGGPSLNVGDVIYFDGAYPHYTLGSRAQRVGLALRLTRGEPIYNGYFSEPRPLDGKTATEHTRQAFQLLLSRLPADQRVPREHFLGRFEKMPRRWRWLWKLKNFLLLYDGSSQLHPTFEQYAQLISAELSELR